MSLHPNIDFYQRASPIWIGIIISILVHLIIFQVSLPVFEKSTPISPIEIVDLPSLEKDDVRERTQKRFETEKKSLQIVESEKLNNEELDPNARFLGEKNQKAEQQTRAKTVDNFRVSEGTGRMAPVTPRGELVSPSTTSGSLMTPESLRSHTDELGITEAKQKHDLQSIGGRKNLSALTLSDLSINGNGGISGATDDHLEGIQEGSRTILSTREFRYFSYYQRIKELLRQHWKPLVEQQIYRIWAQGKSVSDQELVTSVLVVLDERGHVHRISRLLSSGFSELDDAASLSFQRAAPFPNPPKGIIEADGFVRVRWDFIVKTEASPQIRFQSVGGVPRSDW